ncbi:MAG: 4-hydroxy-tetrahydrodipicolinate synthase [Spirochaetales bacterium]|nr:4-hydroxy-tetrahydrodipicolinate synthase [Spirochaetales bacterium]
MKLEGVFTALVTPFKKDETLDEEALRNLVDFQIENGISGLVPVGTTGESPTLDHSEHDKVIELVIEQTNGRVPIIAGTGSNSTKEAIRLTKHAKEAGADYSLQVAPYYNKPTQEGFYKHFMEVAEKADLPIVVYNIPGRSGKNIENSTMLKLAQHPNIVAVKEASGSIPQVMELYLNKPEEFTILSGDDNLGLPLLSCGAKGIISVASNIIPAKMEELVRSANAGNFEKARELHYQLLPFFKSLFIETNPIPIKYGCALKGMMAESYRLPLCEMSSDNKKAFKEIMEKSGLL